MNNKIIRNLKIYLPFASAGIQDSTIYRANWFFRLLGNSIACFVSLFLWSAVYVSSQSENLHGFTFSDMSVYIFLIFLTTTIIYSEGIYTVGEEIRSGAIAMRIIKPVSYDSSFLFYELGKKVGTTYLIAPLIIIAVEVYRTLIVGTVKFRIACFFLYLLSCLLAHLINFFFNISLGFIAFFSRNIWGINMMKNTIVGFLSGSTIPFTFFPVFFEKFLSFLPFAAINYTPVMIYLGNYKGKTMLIYLVIQVFWMFAFWGISKLLWKISMKHLCIQGG